MKLALMIEVNTPVTMMQESGRLTGENWRFDRSKLLQSLAGSVSKTISQTTSFYLSCAEEACENPLWRSLEAFYQSWGPPLRSLDLWEVRRSEKGVVN